MAEKEFERSPLSYSFGQEDFNAIKAEIERVGAKSVLEFGPGDSTDCYLACGIQRIVTCEHKDKWFKVAQKRFKKEPRVKLLRYTDTDPVEVPDLGGEMFDIAFVDSPQGFYPMRKAHPGMEDCSRLNTCLFALKHAKVVLLHDANRPLERGTLGRLNQMGYHWEFASFGRIAMARIESLELHDNGPDSQDAKKPRCPANGSKPKRRRARVSGGTHRLRVRGPRGEERGECCIDGNSCGTPDPARPHRSKRSKGRVRSAKRDRDVHPSPEGGTGLDSPTAG